MITTYFQELISYLTNPHYYYKGAHRSFVSRFLFFIVSLGILSISMSLRIQMRTIPIVKDNLKTLSTQIVTNYPASYTFSWDGSTLTSQPSQIELSFPAELNPSELNLPNQASLVDTTQTEFTESSLATLSALSAISSQRLYVHQQTGLWQSIPLQDLLGSDQRVLNAETAGTIAQEVTTFILNLITKLIPLLYIIMPSILIVSTLWHHFFDFALIAILFQIGARKQSPTTTLKMLLPLLVVVTMIMELALWLYPSIITTFPLRQVAFWVLFTYIFWFGKSQSDHTA